MHGWGKILGDRSQQGYMGLAIVVGSGLTTAVAALSHASQTDFGPSEAVYVFTPVLVSIALVVAGALLWVGGFDGREMLRIGASVFFSMAAFGLLATWTITHEIVRGSTVSYASFVTVNSMSVGGFIGLLIGWSDARNRRTERRLERERNKFKEQTEELDEFAAVVSHDLRNPLNVATLQLQNAQTTSESPETADALDEVEQSLDRMERIIEDVLAMVREGQAIDDVEPVSLSDVADAAWANVDTRGAVLETPSSARIRADRGALEHIFENLFRNSVEHATTEQESTAEDTLDSRPAESRDTGSLGTETPVIEDGGGSDLTVRVGALEDGFYVEDSGAGFPADVRDSMFESGVTTNDEGTGLGLSIVEKLVTAHDWQVRATAGTDGGARFEFTGVEFGTDITDSWLSDLD